MEKKKKNKENSHKGGRVFQESLLICSLIHALPFSAFLYIWGDLNFQADFPKLRLVLTEFDQREALHRECKVTEMEKAR